MGPETEQNQARNQHLLSLGRGTYHGNNLKGTLLGLIALYLFIKFL